MRLYAARSNGTTSHRFHLRQTLVKMPQRTYALVIVTCVGFIQWVDSGNSNSIGVAGYVAGISNYKTNSYLTNSCIYQQVPFHLKK